MENNEQTQEKLVKILYELQRLNKNFEQFMGGFKTQKNILAEGELFVNTSIGSSGTSKKSEK